LEERTPSSSSSSSSSFDATVVSVSPAVERVARSAVVSLRVNHLSADSVMALTERGDISIWSLNCLSGLNKPTQSIWHRSKKFRLASQRASKAVKPPVNFLPLLFRMSLVDLTFPLLNGLQSPQSPASNTEEVDWNPLRAIRAAKKAAEDVSSLTPTVCCFHPSFNLCGQQLAVVIGSAQGDIVKINIDAMSQTDRGRILSPCHRPFVAKEYVRPDLAPKGFVLQAGRPDASPRGHQVQRELFHFHKSKVVHLEAFYHQVSGLISIDERGQLAVWKYEQSLFCGKVWFKPLSTMNLNFVVRDFITLGRYEEVPAPLATVESLLRARIRSRGVVEGGIVYSETYYPLAAALEEEKEEEEGVMLQYKCDTVESRGKISRKWLVSRVKVKRAEFSIVSTKATADGTEITIFVTNALDDEQVVENAFAHFALDRMEFPHAPIVFESKEEQSVLDYCTGPINGDTLTRFLFVLARDGFLRVYSIQAGMELRNASFPLFCRKEKFLPTTVSVCHSQRFLALSDPSRDYLVYYALVSSGGRSPRRGQLREEAAEIALQTSRNVDLLRSVAVDVEVPIMEVDTLSASLDASNGVIEDILNLVGIITEWRLRNRWVMDVCGVDGRLGVIAPTIWPPLDHDILWSYLAGKGDPLLQEANAEVESVIAVDAAAEEEKQLAVVVASVFVKSVLSVAIDNVLNALKRHVMLS
jgi:hypothetical protein